MKRENFYHVRYILRCLGLWLCLRNHNLKALRILTGIKMTC